MKKALLSITSIAISALTFAQDLPKPSPHAEVEQMIGLTEVEIEYSRPSVKGRTIYGDLVPFNEMWRAGANKATKFSCSEDIEVNGKKLPKGDYSFFVIPKSEGNWTAVFNTETELWGTGDYDAAKDQLRVEMKLATLPATVESMEFRFINVDMRSAQLALDWDKIRATIDITADPREQVKANIDQALSDAEEADKWKVYRSAASYAEDAGNMTDQGLDWIKKSVELKENWYSYWVYAGLLAQNSQFTEAVKMAEKSKEIGMADAKKEGKTFNYESRLNEDIERWKNSK